MLIVQGVSLYQGTTALLKDVNFQVNKSDIVTIMGPSGSGKSSLFSWMIGALSPQFQASGELWLNEQREDPRTRGPGRILFTRSGFALRRATLACRSASRATGTTPGAVTR